MKLKIQYAIVIPDKHGQTIQLFDSEKKAKAYIAVAEMINKSKDIKINITTI